MPHFAKCSSCENAKVCDLFQFKVSRIPFFFFWIEEFKPMAKRPLQTHCNLLCENKSLHSTICAPLIKNFVFCSDEEFYLFRFDLSQIQLQSKFSTDLYRSHFCRMYQELPWSPLTKTIGFSAISTRMKFL